MKRLLFFFILMLGFYIFSCGEAGVVTNSDSTGDYESSYPLMSCDDPDLVMHDVAKNGYSPEGTRDVMHKSGMNDPYGYGPSIGPSCSRCHGTTLTDLDGYANYSDKRSIDMSPMPPCEVSGPCNCGPARNCCDCHIEAGGGATTPSWSQMSGTCGT